MARRLRLQKLKTKKRDIMAQLIIKQVKRKVQAKRVTVVSIKGLTKIKQVPALVKDLISKKVAHKGKEHQLNPISASRLN